MENRLHLVTSYLQRFTIQEDYSKFVKEFLYTCDGIILLYHLILKLSIGSHMDYIKTAKLFS